MCFTNLPVEFDEDGNPYLTEEAEEIDHPTGCDCDHTHDYDVEVMETVGCVEGDPGEPLTELNPQEAYRTILETLPEEASEQVAGHEQDTTTSSHHKTKVTNP